ncbi:hypothetical protein K435DRAFT_864328 [Dendrothele bispora CBS 962.96]|uniref:Zn(2)-C6 fungal-type domain-containing protein n=1 Tax=Dendrothele bispora (strain CBS 962.96) TaxID=1314807 RepID=A0A4S8LMC8_DENBC|nr:hypothetical protein K435DRAFT_864328 [Dendrothele bispora CBS 962.96]
MSHHYPPGAAPPGPFVYTSNHPPRGAVPPFPFAYTPLLPTAPLPAFPTLYHPLSRVCLPCAVRNINCVPSDSSPSCIRCQQVGGECYFDPQIQNEFEAYHCLSYSLRCLLASRHFYRNDVHRQENLLRIFEMASAVLQSLIQQVNNSSSRQFFHPPAPDNQSSATPSAASVMPTVAPPVTRQPQAIPIISPAESTSQPSSRAIPIVPQPSSSGGVAVLGTTPEIRRSVSISPNPATPNYKPAGIPHVSNYKPASVPPNYRQFDKVSTPSAYSSFGSFGCQNCSW